MNRLRGKQPAVAKRVERLARDYKCQTHFLSQFIEDLDVAP
jgi:hypothetical protein